MYFAVHRTFRGFAFLASKDTAVGHGRARWTCVRCLYPRNHGSTTSIARSKESKEPRARSERIRPKVEPKKSAKGKEERAVSRSTMQAKKQVHRRLGRQASSQLVALEELATPEDDQAAEVKAAAAAKAELQERTSYREKLRSMEPSKEVMDRIQSLRLGTGRGYVRTDDALELPKMRLLAKIAGSHQAFPEPTLSPHAGSTATIPEFAFIGRSNVGKSYLLDALTSPNTNDKQRLVTRNFRATAAVSSQPGTTQSLDFYRLGTLCRFVDMPGYGYAEASTRRQRIWRQLLESYLTARTTTLKRLFVLVDARWGLLKADRAFIEQLLVNRNVPWQVVLTKCDLVHPDLLARQFTYVSSVLQEEYANVGGPGRKRNPPKQPCLMVSSKTNAGVDAMRRWIQQLAGPGRKYGKVEGTSGNIPSLDNKKTNTSAVEEVAPKQEANRRSAPRRSPKRNTA